MNCHLGTMVPLPGDLMACGPGSNELASNQVLLWSHVPSKTDHVPDRQFRLRDANLLGWRAPALIRPWSISRGRLRGVIFSIPKVRGIGGFYAKVQPISTNRE